MSAAGAAPPRPLATGLLLAAAGSFAFSGKAIIVKPFTPWLAAGTLLVLAGVWLLARARG